MSNVPSDLHYTKDHEWVRRNADGSLTVGITDHAQEQLGDLVFVETPEAGARYAAGADCCVVESVKAASDVYCPVAGEVLEANAALADSPELINSDPYGEGWLFRLQADAADADAGLLDAAAYQALLDAEAH